MAPISTMYCLAASALLSLVQVARATPGVVGGNIEKRTVYGDTSFSLRKRAFGYAQTQLLNTESGSLYVMDIAIGTPPQKLYVVLDTGSSDVWVPTAQMNLCKQGVCTDGAYDPSKSSSYTTYQEGRFAAAYGDGTNVTGDFIKDTLSVGGVNFQNLILGAATQGVVPRALQDAPFTGIIGVSYIGGEFVASIEGTYPTVLSQMAGSGQIATQAFSLWLNDLEAKTGNVLFGGVDTAKYNGPLVVLPLQPDPVTNKIDAFYVTWAGLELDSGNNVVYSVQANAPVLLDSGTSSTYVPHDVYSALVAGMGGEDQNGQAGVPCSLINSNAAFKFKFGNANGAVITAKLNQFIEPGAIGKLPGGADACQLILFPANDNGFVFGDSFLRSSYVVYNIAGNSVAIAETNFNVTSSSIVAITATDSIPGATSTATGMAAATGSAFSASSASGTWSFSTASGSSTSTAHPGSANGIIAPSTAFLSTLVTGVIVILGMISGSTMIFL